MSIFAVPNNIFTTLFPPAAGPPPPFPPPPGAAAHGDKYLHSKPYRKMQYRKSLCLTYEELLTSVGHAMKNAFSNVYISAVVQYANLSPPRTMLPASQFSGESASGSDNRARTARQAACRPQAGLHSFFNMSKQTSPFPKCTLGWNTLVSNTMVGGARG